MNYIPSRRLFLASIVAACLTLLVLVGCALDPPPPPPPTAPPPTPTPLPRGGNLLIRLAEDVPDLRPWQPRSRGEEQLIELMYGGLTRLDAKLQPEPDLASRWDASPDGLQITFTLRTDVSWHDGRPFSADDVAYTLDSLRELSPTTALLNDLQRIAQVTTPTTSTVVLSLTERFAPIFADLAVPILPRHALVGRNIATLNFWDEPTGTGPFQLAERKPGESITLSANTRFYRGQPLLDRVAFLLAPNPEVAAQALSDGRLMLAELPWDVGSTLSDTVKNVQTGVYPENGYYFMAYNTREGRPFADARVRQALALAIDMPALVRDVTGARGIPIASSIVPGSWADVVPPPSSTVDLDRARTLLDDAGWRLPEGQEIRAQEAVTLTAQLFVRGDDERRVRAAELIADAARKIGINIVVQRADFDTVVRSKYAPPYDFDLLLGSWSNGAGDPAFADYLFYDPDDYALFHRSQINQGVADTRAVLNIGGFADGAYDNQAAAARQLYDPADRLNAIRLAQQRIAIARPYLFLWDDRMPVALRDNVTTLDGPIDLNTPLYLGNIERWYLKK